MQTAGVQALDDLDDDELAAWYDHPRDLDRAWVRANFVTSLDGAASGGDGLSGSLGGAGDQRVFHLLRAQADVVLVGAGTARAEGYRRARTAARWAALREREGLAPVPVVAVVSGSLDLPQSLLEPADDGGALLVVTSSVTDPADVERVRRRLGQDAVLCAGEGDVDVADAIEQLAARGLRRVLLEGGPSLMNAVAAADRLDELCLTLTPQLVGGSSPRIAGGAPLTTRLRLAHLLEADGSLLTRWSRA